MGEFSSWNSLSYIRICPLSCKYTSIKFNNQFLIVTKNEGEFSVIHSKHSSKEVSIVMQTVVRRCVTHRGKYTVKTQKELNGQRAKACVTMYVRFYKESAYLSVMK